MRFFRRAPRSSRESLDSSSRVADPPRRRAHGRFFAFGGAGAAVRGRERQIIPLIQEMADNKSGHVYVLELEGANWYVGWSQDINTRIASHFLGAGAKWTQLYKPIAVHSVRPGTPLLETAVTVAMMTQYGWERVRGGSFCNVEMTKPPACIGKAMHYASYKTGRGDGSAPDSKEDT